MYLDALSHIKCSFFYGRKTLNEKLRIAFIFCCSVATDLRVFLHRYFPPTDDLQDLVRYDIKLVLIV